MTTVCVVGGLAGCGITPKDLCEQSKKPCGGEKKLGDAGAEGAPAHTATWAGCVRNHGLRMVDAAKESAVMIRGVLPTPFRRFADAQHLRYKTELESHFSKVESAKQHYELATSTAGQAYCFYEPFSRLSCSISSVCPRPGNSSHAAPA